MPEAPEMLEQLKNAYPDENVYGISVFSGYGITDLGKIFLKLVS